MSHAVTEVTEDTEDLVLRAVRRAAVDVPAYAELLAERRVDVTRVVDTASFITLCPVLTKQNTFERFALDQLTVPGSLDRLAEVLTSSGHGGVFSYGLISREQAATSAEFMDLAFDAAFQVKSRRTLAINCLPMGVGFSSRCMTVATTSVREDMAVALVQAFGRHHEQILLCGDPLFLKRLTDYAAERGVDWHAYRTNVIIGEEVFGEHFRNYLGTCVGATADDPARGYVMSSFGVGELGLHLLYETRAAIAIRRACFSSAALAQDLLGVAGGDALPMVFTFNPHRTFIEIVDADRSGYGRLTFSMLDPGLSMPLLRYQPGDAARLLDRDRVAAVFADHRLAVPRDLPPALIAVRGRSKEALPNGSHVGFYKDCLYADPAAARLLTGAARLIFADGALTLHVQRSRGETPAPGLEERLSRAIGAAGGPTRVRVWPYREFPFGMTLDYERKFTFYVPGEPEPSATAVHL
jgi:phenylacetate-CoA ligase